jgi:HSP20 family molecular chaperone IbpA
MALPTRRADNSISQLDVELPGVQKDDVTVDVTDRHEASLQDGVLHVVVPKAQMSMHKKIEVK